jgi:mono/diheme cytochrome c family protein
MRTFILTAVVAALVSVFPDLVSAEPEVIGAKEYQRSCLTCHGVGGRGDGPMSQYLTVKPADLTQIRKNNDGLFPIFDILQIIDGTTARYLEEDGGNYKGLTGEEGVRLRILELLFYIQSIQQ